MKKIRHLMLVLLVLVQMLSLPIFAYDTGNTTVDSHHFLFTMRLDEYYSTYSDPQQAIEQFGVDYPQYTLCNTGTTHFSSDVSSRATHGSDVTLIEHIYHDEESEKYYYYARWEWEVDPSEEESFLNPDDVIGIVSSDSDEIWTNSGAIINCYNAGNELIAYYYGSSVNSDGDVYKESYGANYDAYRINDEYIRTGSFSIYIDYNDFYSGETLTFFYGHSYSSQDYTGQNVGIDIGVDGAGVSVGTTWENNVHGWTAITEGRAMVDINI